MEVLMVQQQNHRYILTLITQLEPRTYYYRLKQIDFSGQYEYSDEIEVKS